LSSYELPLTSLCHGADVVHVATGAPVAGTEARAVVACRACGREFLITALLRPLVMGRTHQPDPAFRGGHGCGTREGYLRHLRRGELIDEACREANARYQTPTGGHAGPRW
jgi:predicted RNA-binding Zn-ribbon protein involved in translation (DUF1610 family)